MASFQELARKKVAGIPVLYLAGAFVTILAIVAYKMKPTSGEDLGSEDGGDQGDPTNGAADYSGQIGSGTVIVAPSTPDPVEADKPTNEEWGRSAVDYLVESNLATPSVAEAAIHKYLEGADLTFEQGKLKDAAILKLKLPPEPLVGIGSIGTAPAQRQFTSFPGKHTVKGSNDDGLTKIAALYYGRSETPYTTLLSAANTNLPRYGRYSPGTVVNVPAYIEPKYYTAGSQDAKTIAAKNGISTASLQLLNPGMSFPVKKGQKVRVH